MYCGLKEFLKPHRAEVYTLFKEACLQDILRAPCTLVIPSKDTLATIRRKIDSVDEYQDGVDSLKGYILTTPVHDLDSTSGSFRTKNGPELMVENGSLNGSKLVKVREFVPRMTIPRGNGEQVGKYALYELKGAEKQATMSYQLSTRSPEKSKGKRVIKKRVPKKRGGDGYEESLMFRKHYALMRTKESVCSPFSEAMGYLLGLVIEKKDPGVIMAVRLVASYDPAVFYLSLNLDDPVSSIIPSAMLSNWNPTRKVRGEFYLDILREFMRQADQLLNTAGINLNDLYVRVENYRKKLEDRPEDLEGQYERFGQLMRSKNIPITKEQKRYADSIYWRASCTDGGYLTLLATMKIPINETALALFATQAFVHIVFSEKSENCEFEQDAAGALERQNCGELNDEDPIIRFARQLVNKEK